MFLPVVQLHTFQQLQKTAITVAILCAPGHLTKDKQEGKAVRELAKHGASEDRLMKTHLHCRPVFGTIHSKEDIKGWE